MKSGMKAMMPLCLATLFLTAATAGAQVFDDKSVGAFDQLTKADKMKIAKRRVYFEHASVGYNLLEGLRAVVPSLAVATAGNPAEARKWLGSHVGLAENPRGNPGCWEKVKIFAGSGNMPAGTLSMMKFCYIDDDGNVGGLFNSYRDAMERLERANPGVCYVWWTMPVMTSDNQRRFEFNKLVRGYCQSHRKPLFDIASIEADNSGNQDKRYSEDGGHLNQAGQRRVAKAFAVMLARL